VAGSCARPAPVPTPLFSLPVRAAPAPRMSVAPWVPTCVPGGTPTPWQATAPSHFCPASTARTSRPSRATRLGVDGTSDVIEADQWHFDSERDPPTLPAPASQPDLRAPPAPLARCLTLATRPRLPYTRPRTRALHAPPPHAPPSTRPPPTTARTGATVLNAVNLSATTEGIGFPSRRAADPLTYSDQPCVLSWERVEGVSLSLPFSDLLALTSSHMFLSVMD
jgi:hypothetical protein